MKIVWIRGLFAIAGIFDLLVGALFFFAGNAVFDLYGVTRPNHPGYIQFPALLLLVFGVMMIHISRNPVRYRNFMWYAMGLKASYAGIVFYHQIVSGIPSMWIPFAVMDSIFLVLFFLSWKMTKHLTPG
jgi:hypothetical protein